MAAGWQSVVSGPSVDTVNGRQTHYGGHLSPLRPRPGIPSLTPGSRLGFVFDPPSGRADDADPAANSDSKFYGRRARSERTRPHNFHGYRGPWPTKRDAVERFLAVQDASRTGSLKSSMSKTCDPLLDDRQEGERGIAG